jgi:hypothetical protein
LEEMWQNLFSDFSNLPQLACEIVFVLVRGTSRASKAHDASMVATHIAAITCMLKSGMDGCVIYTCISLSDSVNRWLPCYAFLQLSVIGNHMEGF